MKPNHWKRISILITFLLGFSGLGFLNLDKSLIKLIFVNTEIGRVLGGEVCRVSEIYITEDGKLLGGIIETPVGRIVVESDGDIDIKDRDYTAEIQYIPSSYQNGGKVSQIGNVRISYIDANYQNEGKVSQVGDIRVSYLDYGYENMGKISQMGRVRISYVDYGYEDRGKISQIDNVKLTYNDNGMIKKLSSNFTSSGVRIIIDRSLP